MTFDEYLASPVSLLKGVGPARQEVLRACGIGTFKDVLLLLPRRYRVRGAPGPIEALAAGESGAAGGEVKSASVSGRGRRRNLRVQVCDGTGQAELLLFGRGFMKGTFRKGRLVTFQGKVTETTGRKQLLSPDFHLEGDAGPGFPGLVPVYSLPAGIFPRMFSGWVDRILSGLPGSRDWMDDAGLDAAGMMPLAHALVLSHCPSSPEEAEAARRRIAYEEFFSLQFELALERLGRKKGARLPSLVPASLDRIYESGLPFRLTEAQERARNDIRTDLESGEPMHRLLQGDVGSGKTVVALYPLLAAALSGGQAALMAPTEILARQHAELIGRLLAGSGIGSTLIRAGLPAAEVRGVLDDPSTGIVVGTHTLIQKRITFRDLKVCVIDEQQKFGVRQRWDLRQKGRDPHILVMTATPIPRTLALTLYGELDLSVLDGMPPGRLPVSTRTAPSLDSAELVSWIESELSGGGRAFMVCPLVSESDRLDLEAAVQVHQRMKGDYGSRYGVALLHGGMKQAEKDRAVDAFRSGEKRLLVTTVVVEVGMDIPDATGVVILDAWRFGLSQLHQIRGRVGRGRKQSSCYLVGEPPTEAGRERVSIIAGRSDGFRIAEEDLKMRGPGEPSGIRQHGLPPLRAGDYINDLDLLAGAQRDARSCAARGSPVTGRLFDDHGPFRTWIG